MIYDNYGWWWIHVWHWQIADMQARIELNPLSWHVGFALGPLGVRVDVLCVGFGLTWGAAAKHLTVEEIEREMLKELKRKYEGRV